MAHRFEELENLLEITLSDGVIDMECWMSFIKDCLRKKYAESELPGRMGLNGNPYEDYVRYSWLKKEE